MRFPFTASVLRGLVLLLAFAVAASVSFLVCPVEGGQRGITNADVVGLVKLGWGDEAIIRKIRRTQRHFDTSPLAIKELRKNGVSDAIIKEICGCARPASPATSEAKSITGTAQPQRSTGNRTSEPDKLTPDQLEALERATRNANPVVPLPENERKASPGQPKTTEPLAPKTNPETADGCMPPQAKKKKEKQKSAHPH